MSYPEGTRYHASSRRLNNEWALANQGGTAGNNLSSLKRKERFFINGVIEHAKGDS